MKNRVINLERVTNHIFYGALLAALAIVISTCITSFYLDFAHRDEEPTTLTYITEPEAETREPLVTVLADVKSPAEYIPNPYEVELIGRTIWGEAGGVQSKAERAAVAWCILNRVDAYGESIREVVTAPSQFHGYRSTGVCPETHLELAADVLTRWHAEKKGLTDVGRTLPADYLYFVGDGFRNHFSIEYESDDFWDWSLEDPYK